MQQGEKEEEKKISEPKPQQPQSAYTWGLGAEGQLGTGGTDNIKTPYRVKLENVKEIAAGGQYSAILNSNGELFMMGSNKRFKLGMSEENNIVAPLKIKLDTKVRNIACGDWHTVICDEQGICYGTGYNKNGCLGQGSNSDLKQFTRIPISGSVAQISCGRNITLFLANSQQILSSGCASLHGNKESKDQLSVEPIGLLRDRGIISISAGFSCCACVADSGELFTWGHGTDYQLGHGNSTDVKEPKLVEFFQKEGIEIAQASCGRSDKHCHMGCVDKSGFCYTWGSAYKGKLGHGKTWTHGQKQKFQVVPKKIEILKEIPVCQYLTGGIHSAVVTRDGKLMTFGCGSDGRLGHPEMKSHKYLYKEAYPKEVKEFEGAVVLKAATSYYHMIALVQKK